MKNITLIIICFLAIQINAQKQHTIKESKKFQQKLDKEFANKEKSPLTEEDIKTFKALDFFPIDSSYIVTAKLKIHKDTKPFPMKTTTDRLPIYKLYATAFFKIKGVDYELEIYQNQKLILTNDFEDYLFLPFTDKTNAVTSYGGGRYIDLKLPKGDTMLIDFNMAYNPYCAYNGKYSCPIPPKANYLNTEINAGVKAYKGH